MLDGGGTVRESIALYNQVLAVADRDADALAGLATLYERERRWPALVAFLFGLVHGLGFAGALKDIGLPQNHLLVALLTFNIGVELGQLLTVACCYGLYRVLRNRSAFTMARVPALYAIGSVAAFWSLARIVKMLA